MSPIGRIFIVLNLVLAVVFLGSASATLSASQDYKQQFEDEQALRTANEAALNEELDDVKTKRNTLERDVAQMRSDRDAVTADRDRTKADLDEQKTRADGLEGDISTINGTLQTYADNNTNLTDKFTASQSALQTSQDERHAAENDKQAAVEEQARLENELRQANTQIAALQTDLTTAARDLEDTQVALQTVIDVTGTNPADIMSMPQIDGAVLMVSNAIQPGLVSINKGSNDKVQRGFTFDIFSGGQFKGQVRVETVQSDMCTAVIVKTYEGRTIEQGDSASTRI